MRYVETTSAKIIATLLQRSATYRPESYNNLSLLQILKPAEALFAASKRMAHDTKAALLIYLVQHLVITAFYLPTSIIVLRRLRQKTCDQNTLASNSVELSSPNHQKAMVQVRKRLINHAFLICLDEFLYLPPLVYLFFFAKGNNFQSDPTWTLIEQVIIHGPPAIIGNIILAFLIQNTLYGTRKCKDSTIVQPQVEILPHYPAENGKMDEVMRSVSY
ncbi:hypothetical protein PTTG_28792 [Puccinia triticina 1-1 BBBD Race 1]|uniref:Uncharacterized protein n=2 Tax=Puccinia triticina TaxID=208348 RepID=A0A180G9E8_PUCT1|nr:hypothetical protein PTTG_28792 [Puccinia triticina 1-1 BBBD Race 1]